jgi:hypothetical protein
MDRLVNVLALSRAINSFLCHCRLSASHVFATLTARSRDTFVFKTAFLRAVLGFAGARWNNVEIRFAVYALTSQLFYLVKGATIFVAIMGVAFARTVDMYHDALAAIVTASFYAVGWCIVAVYIAAFFSVATVFFIPIAQ